MNPESDTAVDRRLRSILLQLARQQENLAATEAAGTPYWSPCPSTVLGHRTAAAALRTQADLLVA